MTGKFITIKNIEEGLDMLDVHVAYMLFDNEATNRELEALRKML